MNKQQNLTEFWDDFISLEEPEIADENLNEDLDTNLTKAKELLKPYITNHFSTGSYYIDENGIIYDLGNSGYGHAEVSELLNDNGLEIDYKIGKSSKFLKSAGWIRLNTNLNFIELPEERITEEQKRSLLLALDLMLNNVKMDKKVQVNANNQRAEYENCLPEYIIKRIERYYTSGTLYESKVLDEVYPNKGESKKDFINRFMGVTTKEYPDVKQRYAVANSYWERRDRKRLKESEDHTQKAIDVFGTTYYKTRAGFMLKDGRLLDLTYGGGPREDHRNIQDAFDDVDLETDSDYLIGFMNEGNIRLIPEIPGIDVATEPTVQQRKSLKDYIQYWINHKKHFEIQYSNEKGQQIGWKEYNGYYPVDNIIEDLLNHFKLTEALSKETATAIIEGDQTHLELRGSVEFTQLDDSVRLNVKLKGLPKSQFLGFHIHSGSECAGNEKDPFKDVGSHYNPGRRSHPDHMGDLPSLYSSTGEIDTSFETDRFKLKDVVGRAIIIHSQRDDFKSQPSGDAGSKIACGIIKEVPLTEAYLDPEERFWDYRTGQISGNKLFDITRSESSYGQSFLDNLGKADSRGRVGKIVEMSPTEYFKACAKGFGSSYDAQINQIKADKGTYQLLSDVIDKYNRQFPITYLDYSKGFAQEGRHRMYVAGERFGWNTKFPVLVIEAEESPLFELKENKDPSHKEKYVVTVNRDRALIYGNNKRDLMYRLSLIEDNISEEYFETIWKIIRNSNIG